MSGVHATVSRIRMCLWAIAVLLLIDITGNTAGRYVLVTGIMRMMAEHDHRVQYTVVANQNRVLANQAEILARLERLEASLD